MIKVIESENVFVVPDGTKRISRNMIPDDVVEVQIPNSVTTIEKSAFQDCRKLKSINIPNSVTTIGSSAFEYCYELESVKIPNSVTTIGICAFSFCKKLESINIPNSITEIDFGTFGDCYELKFVKIPNSVTTIGERSFSFCSKLESINIPNSVTTICEEAFAYCPKLESINIPSSVTTIGDYAFAHCPRLESSLKIPNSVTNIGNYVFGKKEEPKKSTNTSTNINKYRNNINKYRCEVVKNIEPMLISDFLEDRSDIVDEDGIRAYKNALKGGRYVYYISSEDADTFEDYFDEIDYDEWVDLWNDIFEPMQYADFYDGSAEDVSSGGPGGGAVTIIHTSFGDIIQEGGGGFSLIAFNNKTRNGLIKFLRSKKS